MPITIAKLPKELTAESSSELAKYLDLKTAARLAAVNKNLRKDLKQNTIWKERFKRHFPHRTVKEEADTSWETEFKKAYQEEYRVLTPEQRKLFSAVKESNFEILKTLKVSDLSLRDSNDVFLFDWAKKQGQPVLNFIYGIIKNHYADPLKPPINPEKKDEKGNTLLHWAAICNQSLEVIQALVQQGYNINAKEGDGKTTLHLATDYNQPNVVRVLLTAGGIYDGLDESIHRAALSGIFGPVVAKRIIDVNSVNRDGYTPLYIAAEKGHLEIVNALVAAGADVNAARTHNDGATPLYMAAQEGHLEIVSALLTADADVNAACTDGGTPLHIAAQEGHLEIVNALLTADANIDAACTSGATPLYMATQEGRLEIVSALVAAGANLNAACTGGSTPLYMAAQKGHLAVVNALVAAGANVSAARTSGATPLYMAAQEGHLEIVNALVATGANVNAARTHNDGATPLYIAAQQGHLEIVGALLAAGANLNAACTDGTTPLYVITQSSHFFSTATPACYTEIAKALLRNYIRERTLEAVRLHRTPLGLFGYGYTLDQKVSAAQAALDTMDNPALAATLEGHRDTLRNGRLGKIVRLLKTNPSCRI